MRYFTAVWSSGVSITWRSLSWSEYRRIERRLSLEHKSLVYSHIYRTCITEGPIYEEVPAGIVEWLGRHVVEDNPFNGKAAVVRQVLEQKRKEVGQSFLNHARATIAAAFHYKFEEIDQWDASTVFERYVMAESLSGKAVDVVDPAELAALEEASKKKPTKDTDPKKPSPNKKELTKRQQMVLDRVRGRI